MDQDLARRQAALAQLREKVGSCAMNEAIKPISAMEGTFTWTCASGRISGRVQRAPLEALQLQVLEFRLETTD
jgi:hypothetical protein